MMVINYFWGQKYYHIPYDLKRIGIYFAAAILMYILSRFSAPLVPALKYFLNSLLLLAFLGIISGLEKKELLSILKKKKG